MSGPSAVGTVVSDDASGVYPEFVDADVVEDSAWVRRRAGVIDLGR